jgi:hypothetical protein
MPRTISPVPPQVRAAVARYSVAGAFIEALAARDFGAMGPTLTETSRMLALLPDGLHERDGREKVCAAFDSWFGASDDFEFIEAVVGAVGSRLYLRWRMRLRDGGRGAEWSLVEQQAYLDTDGDGMIAQLRLLSSGVFQEPHDS